MQCEKWPYAIVSEFVGRKWVYIRSLQPQLASGRVARVLILHYSLRAILKNCFSLVRGDRILTFLWMNPSALLAHEQVSVMGLSTSYLGLDPGILRFLSFAGLCYDVE